MKEFKIPLGSKVHAKATGFKGIVISASIHLNGCSRFLVQPKVDKDGKVPTAWWYDEVALEVDCYKAGGAYFGDFSFDLGVKAKDNITGQQGVITSASINLNGVISYWLDPPVDDDNKPMDSSWIYEHRLSKMDEEKLDHEEVKIGGPASSIK